VSEIPPIKGMTVEKIELPIEQKSEVLQLDVELVK